MRCKESPAYICSASETAQDISQELIEIPAFLPEHPLENLTMPTGLLPEEPPTAMQINTLLEVYLDNFIALAYTDKPAELQQISQVLLTAIHSISPPPSFTGDKRDDPIYIKKILNGDGIWAAQNEILGWMFDH